MNSPVWKGVAAGFALFLALSGVALFTPARTPVLKTLGRDYAAVRLEARHVALAAPARGSTPARVSAERPGDRTSPAARLAAWEARAKRFSVFGLMGWLADLWPWLVGFGVALPVLGGLIGAQAGGRRAPSAASPAAVPPAREADSEEVAAPAPGTAELPASEPPPPLPPPTPPETWNWNARAASRVTPARPKPPPVESPNADPL